MRVEETKIIEYVIGDTFSTYPEIRKKGIVLDRIPVLQRERPKGRHVPRGKLSQRLSPVGKYVFLPYGHFCKGFASTSRRLEDGVKAEAEIPMLPL